jgi:hypothetical protein
LAGALRGPAAAFFAGAAFAALAAVTFLAGPVSTPFSRAAFFAGALFAGAALAGAFLAVVFFAGLPPTSWSASRCVAAFPPTDARRAFRYSTRCSGGNDLICSIAVVLDGRGRWAVGVPAGTGTPICSDHHAAISTDTDRAFGFTSVVRRPARAIVNAIRARRATSVCDSIGSPPHMLNAHGSMTAGSRSR